MESLRKRRATIKSSLTRFNNYLETFTSLSDIEDLQSRLEKALPLLDKFEAIQEEIESYGEIDLDETVQTREDFEREKLLREEEEISNFEDIYHRAIGKAKGIIKGRQAGTPLLGSVSRAATESPGLHSEAGPLGVSLPKITLPTFDGTISHWIKFRDSFNSLIHERAGLSNIQKFHYLNSALTGDAARTIEALGVSDANYEPAWEELKSRYEDPSILVRHHVQALFESPSLTRDSSYTDLRQLLDNTKNHLLALRTLGKKTEFWDPLIIHLVTSKLNGSTKREWGRTLANFTAEPTFKDFTTFLEKHIKFLQTSEIETMNSSVSKVNKPIVKSSLTKPRQVKTYATTTNRRSCPICKGTHPIYACEVFKGMSIISKLQKVRDLQLCFNCLGEGHKNRDCTFGPCRKCGKKHNMLIHRDNSDLNDSGVPQVSVTGAHAQGLEQVEESRRRNEGMSSTIGTTKQTLTARVVQQGVKCTVLSTAKLYIYDCNGQRHECRALLDSGSEPHIMTKELCNRLGLVKTRSNLELMGIEQGSLQVKYLATAKVRSRISNFSAIITCIVLDKISNNVPSTSINPSNVNIPKGVDLADPEYNCSGPVDLIIGASLFLRLLSVGQICISGSELMLQKTVLGWIVAGDICLNSPRKLSCNLIKNQDLNEQLERFWKVEHCFLPSTSTTKRKRDDSEQHFMDNTKRDDNGRFVVRIPFKDNLSELGTSLEQADKRFQAMERKLSRNPDLKKQYVDFMEEYEELGHMREISASKYTNTPHFYLPHHAVVKEGSTTTKLRVVFDGSAKSSSGLSLNDVQHIGPIVQDDLFTILVRFRKHSFVLSADIAKMYRQIKINEHDRAYQLILWRSDTNKPIKHYELNTITYGTASAPFLATRCLEQLSEEVKKEDPFTSHVIRHDFYVDDLLTGTDDINEAAKLKTNLIDILNAAGLELRKWGSNELRLLTEGKDMNKEAIPLLDKDPKTLGILWDPVTDTFKYNIKYSELNRITKRTITSIIAQIFDPLGLVGPTVINAKIILQKLWQLHLDWDESLPQELDTTWKDTYKQLRNINDIVIHRHAIDRNAADLQFHGFCDASESAYGACIYIRTRTKNNKVTVRLLCAKSRVAPLKATTLPRLELLGALLLAQLAQKVSQAYDLKSDQWYYWSDSMIVLSWIRAPSSKWKTFVANRIAEIQELTNDNWNHVESAMNPADIISRGMDATELIKTDIWWHGPTYLSQERNKWPTSETVKLVDAPEQRQTVLCIQSKEETANATQRNDEVMLRSSKYFDRFSSFTRLIRTTAYIMRFYNNCESSINRRQQAPSTETNNKNRQERGHQPLKTEELKLATSKLIKLAQTEEFADEIDNLSKGISVSNSRLVHLNPFIDKNGILRVGGRLSNAYIPFEQKHPIILSSKHRLTYLIIKYEHERLLHAGCQSVLSSLRRLYWPLAGRNLVKRILHECITCFRAKPKDSSYIMGNLPTARVLPARPFYNCGVDFAGPFLLKEGARARVSKKSYICIFICMVTKAIHIELARDLSTEAFLNCLRRFISRRGRCKNIYSDNGKNFVGAKNELAKLVTQNNEFQSEVTQFLTNEQIEWHFIPPYAPHFGGLWESAVKSAKFHLKRVIGETRLTFEEFYTIITQVEACLNSRPLSPLSNDPNDFTPLTPGHFLIGDSLMTFPQEDVHDIKTSRLNRYQHLQQMFQHFWKRWQREYLPQLQSRYKWFKSTPNALKIGNMVLVREDNVPAMQWPLGRITECHSGKDNIIRVVSVRLPRGIVKRPVSRICVLPIEQTVQ